jgi:hypothetical protein
MKYSIYQKKKAVELVLVPNSEKMIVEFYLVSDEEEIFVEDLFFCTKTNEILKCSQVSLSGIISEDGKGFFPFTCCKKVIVIPEQIGWMWDNSPEDYSYFFLTPFIDENDNTMIDFVLTEDNGKCFIEIEEICPNYNGAHIGKDCSCKSGFIDIPKLHEGKVIIHLNY